LGFVVFLVAGEFLADVVAGNRVFEAGVAGAVTDADIQVFAKRHKITPRRNLPERVRDHTRTTQMIRRRISDPRTDAGATTVEYSAMSFPDE